MLEEAGSKQSTMSKNITEAVKEMRLVMKFNLNKYNN